MNQWRKSSRSGSDGGNCVETRLRAGFEIRDSKLGDASSILGGLSAADWRGFLAGVTK